MVHTSIICLHSLVQNANPAVQVKGGSSKAHTVISVVVEPGSAGSESTATESFSATSSPCTGMANVRMLVLDDVSHTSSGMDLGIDPSFSTCSNESPLETSGETTPASLSELARCASQDSGMAWSSLSLSHYSRTHCNICTYKAARAHFLDH